MYIAFHGSWDRDPPTGYKVVEVPFSRGRDGNYGPAAQSNSTSGYRDIWWNANVTQCSATNCFRPAGIVFDALGRMYVTTDASSEGEMVCIHTVRNSYLPREPISSTPRLFGFSFFHPANPSKAHANFL